MNTVFAILSNEEGMVGAISVPSPFTIRYILKPLSILIPGAFPFSESWTGYAEVTSFPTTG